MARSKTTFGKENQPSKRRGKSKKTLLLEVIREKSKLSMNADSTNDDCEKAFFGHILDRALCDDDKDSASLLKSLLDKISPTPRSSMERVNFYLDMKAPLDEQASQVLDAISNGDLPPDVGISLINAIGGVLKIKEVTDLEDRIKALEAQEDE
jgi:hypothetical protein